MLISPKANVFLFFVLQFSDTFVLRYLLYSEETRVKIGVGVRMGWERRRKKLFLQEMCHFEWQNLIAEASRQGYDGEEELQWNSYEIMKT